MAMKALRLSSSALRGGLPLLLRSHHKCLLDVCYSSRWFLHPVHACCVDWTGSHERRHGE